jgi:mannose-6-phosphate isomerase-like protein (cupin superfamily)
MRIWSTGDSLTFATKHWSHQMKSTPINISAKLAIFSEHWSPKTIAQMNDYHFKLVKFKGEFVWHDHKDTDEVFIVLDGRMTIHFREDEVSLKKGELFVVPKGAEHKTSAKIECHAMLVEPAGTVNTGAAGGEKTAPSDEWI